jgi:hypothetical protein
MIYICKNLLNEKQTPQQHILKAKDALLLAEDYMLNNHFPSGEYVISYHGKNKKNEDWGMTYQETLQKQHFAKDMIYISRVDGNKVFNSKHGNKSNHVSIMTLFPSLKKRYS